MATTALPAQSVSNPTQAGVKQAREALRLVMCAGLPLGLFGLLNLGAEAIGIIPLFFSPFGLPGPAGAALHLIQLACLGAAWWALTLQPKAAGSSIWLGALTVAYVVLPFATPPLDSLQLSIVCTSLFLLSVATMARVARISRLASWLMAPSSIVLGLSATLGLIMTAAYTPPFALMTDQPQAPA
ncbi:hypothetical protein [uncultured Devosia sp.]|uniref:hypothetical protein n=1 Tax=uncultured Devosia sp. TaxID=211434 RepID=UPI0026383C82|nr:hypothetical protein [uncultured Devosia sp.]